MNFLERIAGLSPKRLALLAAELNSRLERFEQRTPEPIAVVGVGCRFPGGANDPDSFWRLLIEGRDAIVEVPPDRWDINALYDPNPDASGKMNTRWGGFLDAIDQFDPEFFGISPREAVGMDPQQRVLLEVTWEALENAGLCPDRLAGSQTGVFVGVCNTDYFLKQFETGRDSVDAYVATGNAHSVASGRISYLFGLHGPSLSVDTGCSASLVAVHLACQSLRAGECRVALTGGVNLILMPDTTIVLSKAHMMSPNGRCKAFDASGDGFVRSEGCGMIVLKRLADARADGDQILAVIRGSASNQDGRSNGLTAPNGPSQVAVIREALANGDLQPGDIDYIEAHGTGTSLGDPIEAHALAEVFGPGRSSDCPLRIGSVKTNFGHAESAAGIAGLIKAILAIGHEKIPPSLHLQKLNPHIDWSALPISVPTTATSWTRRRGQRVAGVSSFGFSGTNAHVVVSDYFADEVLTESPAQNAPAVDSKPLPELLVLSARSESALLELAEKYQQLFSQGPDLNLVDVCCTAATGRSHFEHRLAVLARNLPEARERLTGFRSGRKDGRILSGRSPKSLTPGVVFMFTGQGSQYPGMGRRLFETQPAFRRELEKCAEILNSQLEIPLLEALFADRDSDNYIDQTQFTQPALFALEYALAAMWRSWGVEPVAVLGHSVGEYVAACVAGMFSLEDGLRLIAERGRLMGSLPGGGAMAAIFAAEPRVSNAIQTLGNQVAIACVNGPANVVVSGRYDAVDQLLAKLKNEGVRSRSLVVSHAFHSELMDPILDSFQRVAATVKFSEPLLPIVSNVTGKVAAPGVMSVPEYWRRQIRHPVRFADSISTLRETGHIVFLEIGPHPVLTGMARATAPEAGVVWASSLNQKQEDWESVLQAVSTLYVRGIDLDWNRLLTASTGKRVSLPTYPFQRNRFWLREGSADAPRQNRNSGYCNATDHPLLGGRLDSPAITGTVFELDLGAARPAFLDDHRIFGRVMMPSPVYIEMALAGAAKIANLDRSGSLPCEVTDLHIREPLFLPEDSSCRVQLILEETRDDELSFQVCSRDTSEPADPKVGKPWRIHATGRVRVGLAFPEAEPRTWNREEVRVRCNQETDPSSFYESL
ncbi:MAG: acyltransferase domain-containing protein, partial [Verrucomicrobia bacterium]|nr:acyltransferase domain-containing protein [Verrucomicrobiota bacterium]